MSIFFSFEKGDYLLHNKYGIAQFCGLEFIKDQNSEFFKLEYKGGSFVFIPIFFADILKFHSNKDAKTEIDTLGKSKVLKNKSKILERIKETALELIKIAAQRELLKVEKLTIPTNYDEFDKSFQYSLTSSQEKAVSEILNDLKTDKPMDRLVCGDVGFGKTEVALRAIFVSVFNNKKAMFIVPTTILAQQQYDLISKRFAEFNKKVGLLCRLSSNSAQTKKDWLMGDLDILVTTASIKSIEKLINENVGLIVLDEEHHFGAKFKEVVRKSGNLLQLSATPIPRTLNLTLSKIKDISMLEAPPSDRKQTLINIIEESLLNLHSLIDEEIAKNGRVFLVVPRVSFIQEVEKMVEGYEYTVIHGKQSNDEIKKNLFDFETGNKKILISTNIVESGLNIIEANLMIIFHSHMFGLAQLHQLKGRIGRADTQGVIYFIIPPALKEVATERMSILKKSDFLGAGFSLALSDMNLRGAGTMASDKQSGSDYGFGIEAYYEMLSNVLQNKKEKTVQTQFIGFDNAYIPSDFIIDESVRIAFYKKLSSAKDYAELENITKELLCYGELPECLDNLLEIAELKIKFYDFEVDKVIKNAAGYIVHINNKKIQITLKDDLKKLMLDK